MLLYQHLVDSQRARPGREAENERVRRSRVKVLDTLDDVAGYVMAGSLFVISDDEPHLEGVEIRVECGRIQGRERGREREM